MENELIKQELHKRGLENDLLIKYDGVIDYFVDLIKEMKKMEVKDDDNK